MRRTRFMSLMFLALSPAFLCLKQPRRAPDLPLSGAGTA